MKKLTFDEFCGILEDLQNDAVVFNSNDNLHAYDYGDYVCAEVNLDGIRMASVRNKVSQTEELIIEDPLNKAWAYDVARQEGKLIDFTLSKIDVIKPIGENNWSYTSPELSGDAKQYKYIRIAQDDLCLKYWRMVELHNAIESGTAAEHLDEYTYTVDSPF